MPSQVAREQTSLFATSLAKARQSNMKNLEAKVLSKHVVKMARKKIEAAAYSMGGHNYAKLFRVADKDHSGEIEISEFISLLRRNLKIPKELPDSDVSTAFKMIDTDGNGTISLAELIEFAHSGKGWVGYHGDIEDIEVESPPRINSSSSSSTTSSSSSTGGSKEARMKKKLGSKELDRIRHRLAAAAYTEGAVTIHRLCARVDKDHSGSVESAVYHW